MKLLPLALLVALATTSTAQMGLSWSSRATALPVIINGRPGVILMTCPQWRESLFTISNSANALYWRASGLANIDGLQCTSGSDLFLRLHGDPEYAFGSFGPLNHGITLNLNGFSLFEPQFQYPLSYTLTYLRSDGDETQWRNSCNRDPVPFAAFLLLTYHG